MNNIVIAFPKKEVANSIKKILAQSGYTVTAVANTGASALSSMNGLNMGIIICGYRFSDMMYSEIYEYMPKEFQMLLIASAAGIMEKNVDNLMSLSMPLKVHELLQTVEMMDYTITRRRKKLRQRPKVRSKEDQEMLSSAKAVLMERNGFSEEEAHRYIQKRSMDNGTGLVSNKAAAAAAAPKTSCPTSRVLHRKPARELPASGRGKRPVFAVQKPRLAKCRRAENFTFSVHSG